MSTSRWGVEDLAEKATMEGVLLALEHELLLPLRALNEGRQWMYHTFAGQPLPRSEIDQVVHEITASVPWHGKVL